MAANAPTSTNYGRDLAAKCTGTTRDGRACPQPALRLKDYCWRHEPSRDQKNHRGYRRIARKNTKWEEPQVQMGGRWVSKIEDYVRSRGYVHCAGRFKGQTNIYQLSRESGLAYGLLHDFIHDKITDRLGMVTLGKLCGFLACGPSDLIEWESYAEPPKAPREVLDDDYISPEAYRAREG